MTTLVLGKDLVRCDKCKVWYQVSIEHVCKKKDLDAAGFDSNRKNPKVFEELDKDVQKEVDKIMKRVAYLKDTKNSHLGEDGEWHVNE